MNHTKFWVIRHGESEWNEEGRIQGQLDVPLNERGVSQSAATADFLREVPFDAVWSSDLKRTSFLGELIAKNAGIKLNAVPELREWKLGDFQGELLSDLYNTHPEESRAFMRDDPNTTIPNGESYYDILARSVSVFEKIVDENPGKNVAVISHGGILRTFLKHVMTCENADQPFRAIINNCAICRFASTSDKEWKLIEWNSTTHLGGFSPLDDVG